MMKCLLVTATLFEIGPLLERLAPGRSPGLGVPGQILEFDKLTCLVTGVGQLQCGVHLAALLARETFSSVIQAGLAGSFREEYPKGSVVRVEEEVLGDLGAEDNGGFLDLVEMKLLAPDTAPFSEGVLRASPYRGTALLQLPAVRSVTVNRVLSNASSIAWVQDRYQPDIVNMEGAALFLACLLRRIDFIELRSISDRVGPRDKAAWDIPGAVRALDGALQPALMEVGAL